MQALAAGQPAQYARTDRLIRTTTCTCNQPYLLMPCEFFRALQPSYTMNYCSPRHMRRQMNTAANSKQNRTEGN